MKINVDLEITPEELRKLFGLPDVEAFQQQLMEDIRERMVAGVDGYDPIKLFQPYVTGTMASWDIFQKMLTNAASLSSGASASDDKAGDLAKRKG
ncbi:MAG: hypothetical protein EOM91_11420 [Sphingobacteriia bacterium]|nr:hypothetical protein [Sphingobacteriia bacterium]NCC38207.1 hypothetical protein [Gammaproteobacteria bacterium]